MLAMLNLALHGSGPLNRKAMVPALAATISIILSLHVTLTCRFSKLVAPNGYEQYRGIWYMEGFERIGSSDEFKNVCTPYPNLVETDAVWQAAQLFTLVGGITGSTVASFLWSCMFSPLTKEGWFLLAGACFATSFIQGLTLLFINSGACKASAWVLQSDARSCALSTGFDADMAATCMWLITAFIMVIFPPHLKAPKVKDVPTLPNTTSNKSVNGNSADPSVKSGSGGSDKDGSEDPVDLLKREDLPEIC